MNLWQDFLTNTGKATGKWAHYFPVYERHFASHQNKSITFWEIGVMEGGSLQMWQRYFGPFARIVGIDINAECRRHNSETGIRVRIGNQSDEKFLQEVIDEFGVPDIVLDDGSHHSTDIMNTFQYVYPKMGKNGVYAVEDLYIAYEENRGGGINNPNSFINQSKVFVDQLHVNMGVGIPANPILKQTTGISFYNGMIVYEKGNNYHKDWIQSGQTLFTGHKHGQLDFPLEHTNNIK